MHDLWCRKLRPQWGRTVELFVILIGIVVFVFIAVGKAEERKRERKRRESAHLEFSTWMTEVGIELECMRCLSSDFSLLQYTSHGLSFQGQCKARGARKWFKAMRTSRPFRSRRWDSMKRQNGYRGPQNAAPRQGNRPELPHIVVSVKTGRHIIS